MNLTLPLVMIGRRASGKTTALAVLLGQGGFHSSASGLDYSINTTDSKTREYLFDIYKRIKSGVNPKPSEIHNLEKLQLYADINGERVPFEMPDVAGEHFEGGETKDQIVEKTRGELMGVISRAGVLVIIVDYDILQEKDPIDYTNQVGVVLSELKKERYQGQGFIPPVVVAVTKFDKHPRYTEAFAEQQKLLEEELEKSEYLKQIKAIVTGAAGAGNCCFTPISSYGSFKIVEQNGQKTFVPPEEIAPSGLVELLEISMKKLMHQSFLLLSKKPDSTLPEITEKILKLQALMDFAPFPEIDAEIEEELKKLKPRRAIFQAERRKKILQRALATAVGIFFVLVFSFVLKPINARSNFLFAGEAFLKNRQNVKNIADIQSWVSSVQAFIQANGQLDNKALVAQLAQIKKEYAPLFIEADEKHFEAAITAESLDAKKLIVVDSLLQSAREEYQKSFLLKRRAEIFERVAQGNKQVFLNNLANLPISKQIEELNKHIEDAKARKDPSSLEEFQNRLSQCDKKYYQDVIEKLAIKVKNAFENRSRVEKKDWLSFDDLQTLKASCVKYCEVLPTGKMKDKCDYFIKIYDSFEKTGIICELVFVFPATDDDYDRVKPYIGLGDTKKTGDEIPTDYPSTKKTETLTLSRISYKLKDDFFAKLTFIDKDLWRDPDLEFSVDLKGMVLPFAPTVITLPLMTNTNSYRTAVLTIIPQEPINTVQFPADYN